ncbi:Uncharacterised protein [Tatumella ptyseos]|uniref:Uncharacterized protein n=1 Tax=Tatumella ptyseos TaxID=82987 RepID=A0A2X5NHQ8_9GAMM|nr:Uncharacterised protein [Tatumella ptyseos]
MTWTYIITNKNFLRDGVYQFSARYAGAPGYKDQARYQCLKNKGPLPSGHTALVLLIFLLVQGHPHCRCCRNPIITCVDGRHS